MQGDTMKSVYWFHEGVGNIYHTIDYDKTMKLEMHMTISNFFKHNLLAKCFFFNKKGLSFFLMGTNYHYLLYQGLNCSIF